MSDIFTYFWQIRIQYGPPRDAVATFQEQRRLARGSSRSRLVALVGRGPDSLGRYCEAGARRPRKPKCKGCSNLVTLSSVWRALCVKSACLGPRTANVSTFCRSKSGSGISKLCSASLGTSQKPRSLAYVPHHSMKRGRLQKIIMLRAGGCLSSTAALSALPRR